MKNRYFVCVDADTLVGMLRVVAVGIAVSVMTACSSGGSDGTTRAECDAIANDIRSAASKRGIASQGVCSSTNEQIQKDFGEACQRLRECNDRCCR